MSKTRRFRKLPSKHQDHYVARDLTDLFSTRSSHAETLAQIAAKALDALAGIFEVAGLGRIGDAERGSEPECGTLHDRDAFSFKQLGDEVLVITKLLARRRGLADRAGAG